MSEVEVRHLQALVALTEEGSFTDAAIRLGVTQSAVSRTIAAFEQVVGTDLVRRTTRTVALTPSGERTYRAAVRALTVLGEVTAAARGEVRPLRLGYSWSALGRHTTTVLRRWRAERPGIPIEVRRVDLRDGGLARGASDVAVVRGAVEDPLLDSRLVFDEARLAVVATGHRVAGLPSVTLADLSAETVLITAYGTTTLELWPADIRPRASLQVDNTDEWLTEIAGGLAVGVTAESTATQHAHPGVAFVPLRDAGRVEVHLAWPRSSPHPATEEFVALVTAVAAAGPAVPLGSTAPAGAEIDTGLSGSV